MLLFETLKKKKKRTPELALQNPQVISFFILFQYKTFWSMLGLSYTSFKILKSFITNTHTFWETKYKDVNVHRKFHVTKCLFGNVYISAGEEFPKQQGNQY